jgi:hypothetical protein
VATTTFEEHLENPPPHERRHGDRRNVRIPLLFDAGGRRDAVWTSVAEGERVVVHDATTGRTAVARVVALRPAETSSGAASGLRMALRLETHPEYSWGPTCCAAAQAVH